MTIVWSWLSLIKSIFDYRVFLVELWNVLFRRVPDFRILFKLLLTESWHRLVQPRVRINHSLELTYTVAKHYHFASFGCIFHLLQRQFLKVTQTVVLGLFEQLLHQFFAFILKLLFEWVLRKWFLIHDGVALRSDRIAFHKNLAQRWPRVVTNLRAVEYGGSIAMNCCLLLPFFQTLSLTFTRFCLCIYIVGDLFLHKLSYLSISLGYFLLWAQHFWLVGYDKDSFTLCDSFWRRDSFKNFPSLVCARCHLRLLIFYLDISLIWSFKDLFYAI